MSIVKCQNNHQYDTDRFDSCPYCYKSVTEDLKESDELNKQNHSESRKKAIKPVKCINGHYYDALVFDSCPHCGAQVQLFSKETEENDLFKESGYDSESVTVVLADV